MTRYIATFRRHRLGLILPVVIALVISSWYVATRPHKYQASMTVWIDTALPNPSSLVAPSTNTTPAGDAQLTFQELLGTQQFLIDVGRAGPLAGLFSRGNAPAVVDAKIVSTLSKSFTVSVTGPQVLQIAMTGTNPGYMPGTLKALASQYLEQITGSLKSRDQAIVAYYQSQVASAQAGVDTASSAASDYRNTHPAILPTADATYNQLAQNAAQAQEQYTALKASYDQANIALQNVTTSTMFHLIDQPSVPFAVSNKKHVVFTVVAGLAAGIAISLLALSALTALDGTVRLPEDIEDTLGMDVVGVLGDRPRFSRVPPVRRSQ